MKPLAEGTDILIIDDHPLVRAGLLAIETVDPSLKVVGQASTAALALSELRRLVPDVLLLDVRLPDESGLEVCRKAKEFSPSIRVLVLTAFAENELVLAAIEAGADAYLLKANDAARIAAAIHSVLAGHPVFDCVCPPKSLNKPVHETISRLTSGEIRVLALLTKGKTDKEIASALTLSPKTVRNTLDRIFLKIGVNTRTAAAVLFTESRHLQFETRKSQMGEMGR